VECVDKVSSAEKLSLVQKRMKAVLGIFAKEPVPKRVKTRLCPPLTAEEAAGFYRVCLEETITSMGGGGFDLVLFHAGSPDYFRTAYPGLPLRPQGEGNLGERMERALRGLLEDGYGVAALIGTDTPDLPISLVDAAFRELEQAEVVVAPARDGGYVLIGERRHLPELFRQIPWSTAEVLSATRQRAADMVGADYREIDGWEDVDDLPSLRRLLARSPAARSARHAAVLLSHHGE